MANEQEMDECAAEQSRSQGSHWDERWRTHHECAVKEIERLKAQREFDQGVLDAATAEVERLRAECSIVTNTRDELIERATRLCKERDEAKAEVERLRQQHDAAVRSTARQLEHEDAAPFDDCDCKLCHALLEVRDVLAREDRSKKRIAELEAEHFHDLTGPTKETGECDGEDICGLCGMPGADKYPHPDHWPGERVPDSEFVHAECEKAETARAHEALTDEQRERCLRNIWKG